jgi:Tfp pilus assembly protein PilV
MRTLSSRSSISHRHRSGFTLAEALTVTVIFGFMIVSVSTIYMAALRAYRRGEPANSAERKASWAISRMVPDFQQAIAINIDPATQSYVVGMRVPDRAWDSVDHTHYNNVASDGTNLVLVPGDWIYYYRGNNAGAIDAAGSKLWREVIHADGTPGKKYVFAENIINNPDQSGAPKPMFIYWPDVVRLRSVEMTITVREHAGAQTADSTMVSEVCFRNH